MAPKKLNKFSGQRGLGVSLMCLIDVTEKSDNCH